MLLHIRCSEKVLYSVCVLVPQGSGSTCLPFTFPPGTVPPVTVPPTTSLLVSVQVNNNILDQLSSTTLLPYFPLAFSFLTCHSPYTFLLPSLPPFHPLNLLLYLPSFPTLPTIPTLFFTFFLTTSTPLPSSSSPTFHPFHPPSFSLIPPHSLTPPLPLSQVSPTNITLLPGMTVDIHCVATGSPLPTITWLVNSTTLTSRYEQTLGNSVKVATLNVSRGGNYICIALSGGSFTTAVVRVKGE